MRLILRGAARALGDEGAVMLAAGPDSLARQPWQWDLRVCRDAVGESLSVDGAGVGPHHVCVRCDPSAVTGHLREVVVEAGPAAPLVLARPAEQLWVAVVEQGRVRHGGFDVGPGDVLVWEGDDPLGVTLAPIDGPALLVLAALARIDGHALRWVP